MMARKKIEPIISLGNEDKLTVQKSLPLFALWRSSLTLSEFKILDTYLSRIDSHKPDKRTVIFEKGALEQLLGVKRIRIEELDERLKNLGTPIRLDDNTSKNKRFARISLFEKSVAEQDENGLWQVELSASESAIKYFFNIENLGYLRYKLRCITSLTSRYSYIMFIYLEANRFRKSWEVSLEELKEILSCDKEETYKEYKFFNVKILKKVQKELHEKTECRYVYEPIKKGRTVVGIRFTLETLADVIEVDQQEPIDMDTIGEIDDNAELWETPFESWSFTAEQKAELRAVLVMVPDSKLPPAEACQGNKEIQWYHYIEVKVKEMERRNAEKKIRSRFSYLLKLLKNDAAASQEIEAKPKQIQNKFNDFPQREYSSEEVTELERRLLNRGLEECQG